MSSQSKRHPARVLMLLPAVIAFLFMFAGFAAAQDQPAPKWELFGGYSVFDPGTIIHGQLPGAVPAGAGTVGLGETHGLPSCGLLSGADSPGLAALTLRTRLTAGAFGEVATNPRVVEAYLGLRKAETT